MTSEMNGDMDELSQSLVLNDLVDSIFSEGGILSRLFAMEYREQQHHYALDVCRWLQLKQPATAMLEGETGIGKSLAYLIPLAVHLSLTGKRALISTYTVHLIHQLNNDQEIIRTVLKYLGLRPVTVANRLGRAQYVSASRVLALAESTNDTALKNQLMMLHQQICKAHGSHVYVKHWSENSADLNLSHSESSIALTEHCSLEDAHWYHEDCQAAGYADIVLTSHTCSMLYARGVNVFKSTETLFSTDKKRPFNYLIADEADRMPEAAESILRLRSSPRRISSILKELYEDAEWKRSDITKACQALVDLQQVLDETGELFTDTQCILSREMPLQSSIRYTQSIKTVIGYLKPIIANLPPSSEAAVDKVTAIKGFHQSLNNVLNDKHQANCIAWSPVNRQGSIAIDEPFAGLSFSRLIRSGASQRKGYHQPPLSVMLTSGTLGLSGKSGLSRYTPIRSALGLKESDIHIWGHYAPKHYGDIAFILADNVVKPFSSDEREDANYNDAWLDYTTHMLLAAAASGPTLCLCPSFNEVEELACRLSHQPKIGFHSRGMKLDNLVEQLQRSDIHAIVTPSAWEGVSIRQKNGRQLLKNIMVTRIPIQPPNAVTENTFIARYLEQGRSRHDALKSLYSRIRDRALRKFQQGLIGRGIRANNDAITAWVADPRIGPDRQHRLVGVIPERFVANYQKAGLFSASGEIIQPECPSTREVLAWL